MTSALYTSCTLFFAGFVKEHAWEVRVGSVRVSYGGGLYFKTEAVQLYLKCLSK